MESILNELQTLLITIACAAVTGLCLYAMSWLRDILGIKESDSNEEAIRRAALTEAGKLLVQGKINDPNALLGAAAKVIFDLKPQVQAEGYDAADIKDMIIGAAATAKP
jgi:hypothetical protein